MSYHPNGSPVRWLKALLQQQSPNCVASVQLEPKVAILNCCDFRLHHWNIWKSYGNHAMILGTELNLTSPLRFRVAPSCSSKTCIDVIKSSPSLRPSLSEQLESTSAMLNLRVSHGISWYHPSNLKFSLNFSSFQVNLDVTDTRRKKNTRLHVNLTQPSRL